MINYIPSCYSEATTQSPHLKKTVEYTIALNTVTYFPSVFYHLKKKNPHLQKKVNSTEWVKVTAEKTEKVQDNYTLGTGDTTWRATHMAYYEQWQITMI